MEELDYRKYMTAAEVDKAVNTLRGLLEGIKIDNWINAKELDEFLNWCDIHRVFAQYHPFKDLFEIIDFVMEDGMLTEEEAQDMLFVCSNIKSDSKYYDFITAGIQELQGLLHGILADNIINEEEITGLANWLNENDYLKGTFPFDEIDSLLLAVLSDKIISQSEKEMLIAYFSSFIDLGKTNNVDRSKIDKLKEEYHIGGICAACPDVQVNNRTFCFTGISTRASRSEIAERIIGRGGYFKDSVTDKTNYLVVGNNGNPCWAFASYGRKVEKAMIMRREGHPILIINEVDFWDSIVD